MEELVRLQANRSSFYSWVNWTSTRQPEEQCCGENPTLALCALPCCMCFIGAAVLSLTVPGWSLLDVPGLGGFIQGRVDSAKDMKFLGMGDLFGFMMFPLLPYLVFFIFSCGFVWCTVNHPALRLEERWEDCFGQPRRAAGSGVVASRGSLGTPPPSSTQHVQSAQANTSDLEQGSRPRVPPMREPLLQASAATDADSSEPAVPSRQQTENLAADTGMSIAEVRAARDVQAARDSRPCDAPTATAARGSGSQQQQQQQPTRAAPTNETGLGAPLTQNEQQSDPEPGSRPRVPPMREPLLQASAATDADGFEPAVPSRQQTEDLANDTGMSIAEVRAARALQTAQDSSPRDVPPTAPRAVPSASSAVAVAVPSRSAVAVAVAVPTASSAVQQPGVLRSLFQQQSPPPPPPAAADPTTSIACYGCRKRFGVPPNTKKVACPYCQVRSTPHSNPTRPPSPLAASLLSTPSRPPHRPQVHNMVPGA